MPIDPFLRKKWELVFYKFFDTNRNKVIDWGDFEVLFEVSKIKETRGEDSAEYKIVTDAMRMVWQGLVSVTKDLDITTVPDQEMEITLDEWVKMWSEFKPKHMHIWQWEYVKYMFFLIDTSGDKMIDVKEYTEVMKMYGMNEADAKKAFSKFSVDDKGKQIEAINYGQFVRLWTDFFVSTDKTKPGCFLFGDV